MLVFPAQADIGAQRLSVLAPVGTALLGYREGDEVEWLTPGGLRRLRIEKVIQPSSRSVSTHSIWSCHENRLCHGFVAQGEAAIERAGMLADELRWVRT